MLSTRSLLIYMINTTTMKKVLFLNLFTLFIFSSSSFSQEYISFYSGTNWPNGQLTATNLRSDPDNQEFTSYSGCVYADVTMSGGPWKTGGYPRYTNATATYGFGMDMVVDWTNCTSTATMTITFKNASGGAVTEYPVNFSILGLNSHVCGASAANRFIDQVTIQGYEADLTTAATPTITKNCANATLAGNTLTGTSSCGSSNTSNAADVSFTSVARIVITYSSATGHPPTLSCGSSPAALTSVSDPREQNIYISAFEITNPVNPAPSGITGTTSICSGGSTTLTATGGTSSSKWYSGSCGGTLVGTGASITVSPGSLTTYYVANQNLCGITTCASATVAVTPPPNAGTNGSANFCSNSASANLYSSLGGTPAATGTWSGPSVTTGGYLGTYNPVTMTPGTYTYTVVGTGGCPNATATVSVTETAPPNAGSNGPASICETGTPINLFASLGGTPAATGTWSGGLTGANLGTYDPTTFSPGTFTYTVTAAGCADATATVTVTESAPPNAGSNGSASVCETGTPINLFASLGGTPAATGTWSGGLTGANLGTYDPTTFLPGTFTYTVTAAGCADAFANIIVTEVTTPDAGTISGSAALCEAGTAILASDGDASGVWTSSNTSVVIVDASGNVSALVSGTAIISYTVTASPPCAVDAIATFNIEISSPPNAGIDGDLLICSDVTVTATSLFTELGGTPDMGGTWSPQPLGSGVYTYAIVAVAPCPNPSSAIVTVTEEICEIIIPTAFTPGGDGENDTWEIIGLDEKYPSNFVIIYNRWGNEIYRSKEGQYSLAPWDGTYKGKEMPVSSYYYMIFFNGEGSDKEDVMTGTITLIKE